MSRTVMIIGLFVASLAHWMFLSPSIKHASQENQIESAAVAMREIAREMLPTPEREEPAETPLKDPVQAQPTPPPVEPPAEQPAAEPERLVEKPVPPTPNLTRTAESRRASLDRRGDFSGDRNGNQRPVLRIDWGRPDQAMSIVKAGDMRLVMLTSSGGIAGEIQPTEHGWTRIDSQAPDLSGYSNRVRIVDSTTAFSQASSLCNNGERLAVLLPLTLEHKLRTQQIRVATEAGVESSAILAFYGRFRIDGGSVAFDISGYERRTS
ncbi:MAG: hypothetical protein MK089_03415 [Phycisphaerales bacterium]|nr:hypothetical protein [Phycisphaerales bacterium]